jgi:hypothetical protein
MNGLEAQERERALCFQQSDGAGAARLASVLFEGAAKSCIFTRWRGAASVCAMHEFTVVVVGREQILQHVDQAARHAGTEVHACGTEDDDYTGRHVFTGVVADALDDREGAAIADGEAFAGAPGDIEFARSGAI